MYITKREKYDDTSLFIQAGTSDCFGDFVAKVVAKIPSVDEIWMLNMMNMKFFYLPEILLEEWQRFVVSIRTHPNKFEETYNAITKMVPTTDAAPVYIAYTFHLYGDSIMFSIVAKDEEAANRFVEENINNLPEVFTTHITGIKKQHRLATRESWKIYIRSNLITKPSTTPHDEPALKNIDSQQISSS
jgi:hypothetical protein